MQYQLGTNTITSLQTQHKYNPITQQPTINTIISPLTRQIYIPHNHCVEPGPGPGAREERGGGRGGGRPVLPQGSNLTGYAMPVSIVQYPDLSKTFFFHRLCLGLDEIMTSVYVNKASNWQIVAHLQTVQCLPSKALRLRQTKSKVTLET